MAAAHARGLQIYVWKVNWNLARGHNGNTKGPDMGGFKKSHAAKVADQVVEPEADRTVNRK